MINPENLFQLIFTEKWTEILNLLYTEKTDIVSDPILKHAAATFEQVFFNKIEGYSTEDEEIIKDLDTLYLLHNGHFYSLSPESYKILIVELVKRKPISEAYNYAKIFPEEEVCKQVIQEHDKLEQKKEIKSVLQPKIITLNWIEIYNRLFELINDKTDTATYFSGPRFIDTVRQFEPYFPNYTQYIELRNQEGKSTSRQIFYYDILLNLKEPSRQNVINRILEIAKPFQGEKVQNIIDLLDNKAIKKNNIISKHNKPEGRDKPKVFISYSWDDEPHKQWVLKLADKLCIDGVDVILDRYSLQPGKNLPHFVENSISTSDRIIKVLN